MNTEYQPRYSSQDLAEQIKKHIEELATATEVSRVSDEMLRYLESCSRFHQYSFHNIWLILMTCPHATQVAGFQAWRRLNRSVKKGEKGIPILAPLLVKEENNDADLKLFLRGFKVVFVFDVSQTDGEPLPELPDWKSPEKNDLLTERLLAFAQEHGITITEKNLAGEIQGVSKGGSIDLAPDAGTSTLIHELAHELMHHRPDAPAERLIRELEAEATAFIVSRHFGLESAGSPNYIALHGANAKMIMEHLERIRIVVIEIIQFVEQSNSRIGERANSTDAEDEIILPLYVSPTEVSKVKLTDLLGKRITYHRPGAVGFLSKVNLVTEINSMWLVDYVRSRRLEVVILQ